MMYFLVQLGGDSFVTLWFYNATHSVSTVLKLLMHHYHRAQYFCWDLPAAGRTYIRSKQ